MSQQEVIPFGSMKAPETPKEFAALAATCSGDVIYCLFEMVISQSLRDELYAMADPTSPEPCRSAMIRLGYLYHVQSLIDY